MKNIIVAWCNSNENEFENFVPLNFVGKRNKKLGFSNEIVHFKNIFFFLNFGLLFKILLKAKKLVELSNILCQIYHQLHKSLQ